MYFIILLSGYHFGAQRTRTQVLFGSFFLSRKRNACAASAYFSFRKKKSVRKSDRSPKHLCGQISALRRYRPCRAPARLRPLPCRTKICRANLSSVPIRFPQAKENMCTVSETHNAARHKFFLDTFSYQEKVSPARRAQEKSELRSRTLMRQRRHIARRPLKGGRSSDRSGSGECC